MRSHGAYLVAVLAMLVAPAVSADTAAAGVLDRDSALRASQAVIGRYLGSHHLVDSHGRAAATGDFRGRPLVVNLVYTSCYHSCNVSTRYLSGIVDIAREALGVDAFSVVTIGFDSANDTPARMAEYAARQDIDQPDWLFLSGDRASIGALVDELGFTYAASPKGFDHMAQVTVVDAEGRIYRQVYGDRFEPPALVEPLKELVWGLDASPGVVERWVDNVRLFCTIYDPSTGRYRFDYSIFVGIIVGGLCLGAIAWYIVRAWRESSSRLAH